MEKPQAPPRPDTPAKQPAPENPNPGAAAPRPSVPPDTESDAPDMDHPPRARSSDQPAFDKGVSEEERDRRGGTLPQR
jgi:hypothetical protein